MGKVIACVNEKGGVSKTTTIKNLASGLASRNYKVLAIDLDPSANLTKSVGLNADPEFGTICEILDYSMDLELEKMPEGFGITHQEEGFDVITSSNDLHDSEDALVSVMQREVVLRRYIQTIKDQYDYILIDCPAGLTILVINALFAADSLIIPLMAEFLPIEAMQNLFKKISDVRKLNGTGTKPEILGALFTQVRANTTNNRMLMQQAREQYGRNISFFDTYIPLGTFVPESDLARQSIFKYAPKSTLAMSYMDLVDEFIKKTEGQVD